MDTTLCMGCMEFYDAGLEKCPHCGLDSQKGMEQSAHLDPGTILLDRYIVGKILNINGCAVFYIGYDTRLDKKIVIEEAFLINRCERGSSKDIVPMPGASTEFEKCKKMSIEEGNKIQSLRNTPEFTAMNLFAAHNTVYTIREYIQGQSLSQYLSQKGGKLPLHESLMLISKVLCGVERMHLSGLCHRTISPSEITLTDRGEIKILGLHNTVEISSLKKGKRRGDICGFQFEYAPPEVYSKIGYQGTWTDIYSVAAVLYRMIVGEPPIEAANRLNGEKLLYPSEMGIQIPQSVERAIIEGLEPNVRSRIKDVRTFRNKLFC